jgi:AcrR family transcriptional regulator
MARIDADEKRREVAIAATRVIAEGGMDALTIRAVADAMGCSISIVQYYFRNKHDLLVFTQETVARNSEVRFLAALAARPGDLFHLLSALMPLTATRRQSAKVWHAYAATASLDPDFIAKVRAITVLMRRSIGECLRANAGDPAMRKDMDIELVARRLLTFVYGVALEGQFNAADWPVPLQRQALADNIRDLTGLVYAPDNPIWEDQGSSPPAATARVA